LKRICVFCGSRKGTSPAYAAAAVQLGEMLAREGIGLVFGAGSVGIMGVLVEAVARNGGETIGVVPRAISSREPPYHGLTELRMVDSLAERKVQMIELSDAFIALPGGIGTLDEFFEVWTLKQLGMMDKPIGLLNVAGYFDPLLELARHLARQGFLKQATIDAIVVSDSCRELLVRLDGGGE
jgi:uncharacterized protein (TIGR00730 family)